MSRHPLPYLAVARADGPDATAFLHAQLSADIAGLRPGEARFACYCSPRGQVFGLLLVCRRDEEFLLVGSRALLPGILRRLGMFVLRAQVRLREADDLQVAGEDGQDGDDAPWLTPAGLAYRVLPASAAADAGPGGEHGAAAWKARELEQGVAWLDSATSERFIPQMLGFDSLGAVSFSKGCYPGQEIVARARYLGKVKRKPLLARAQGAAEDAFENGAAISFAGGGQAFEGSLVDSAPLGADRLLFTVAAVTDTAPERLELDGRSYGCATM